MSVCAKFQLSSSSRSAWKLCVVGGGVCKVIFMSNPTIVLRLGWGFDKKENLKNSKYTQNIFALPGVLKTVSLKSEFLQKVIVKDLIL